jgi:hypothetical protein
VNTKKIIHGFDISDPVLDPDREDGSPVRIGKDISVSTNSQVTFFSRNTNLHVERASSVLASANLSTQIIVGSVRDCCCINSYNRD